MVCVVYCVLLFSACRNASIDSDLITTDPCLYNKLHWKPKPTLLKNWITADIITDLIIDKEGHSIPTLHVLYKEENKTVGSFTVLFTIALRCKAPPQTTAVFLVHECCILDHGWSVWKAILHAVLLHSRDSILADFRLWSHHGSPQYLTPLPFSSLINGIFVLSSDTMTEKFLWGIFCWSHKISSRELLSLHW